MLKRAKAISKLCVNVSLTKTFFPLIIVRQTLQIIYMHVLSEYCRNGRGRREKDA